MHIQTCAKVILVLVVLSVACAKVILVLVVLSVALFSDKMIVLLVISMLLLLASCIVGRNRKCAPTQTDDGSGLEEKVTLVPRSFGLKARQRHSLPASGDVAKVKGKISRCVVSRLD